jgi:NAD(P) transhydrogenase
MSAPRERFDLVVLGSGPAGEKGAAQAAYFGKRVLVVEPGPEPGGAAVHTGTLPSKTLRETALYLSGHRARELYGIAVTLAHDATLQTLMARKRAIAAAEAQRIRANLDRHSIELRRGHGHFVGPHALEIVGPAGERREVEADVVLVATGSRPRQPRDIDFVDARIHDSDEVLHIEELPRTLVILGAGVIGCEYASMFAALGVAVTLVEPRPALLPFLDRELAERLQAALERLGVRFVLGETWSEVARVGEQVEVRLSGGELLRGDQLLFSAGRVGNTDGLGLAAIGLEPDARGYLPVDAGYRTAVPHVFAAGDVIGFPALASVSMEQGRVAVCHAFGFDYKRSVSDVMPYGIYTIPEVSSVGLSASECARAGQRVVEGRASFRDNARGMITGDIEGFTKLVVDADTRAVVGVHVLGERATELVHIGQAIMLARGTVDTLIEMVFNYPTLAESYKYAAYACLDAIRRGELVPAP